MLLQALLYSMVIVSFFSFCQRSCSWEQGSQLIISESRFLAHGRCLWFFFFKILANGGRFANINFFCMIKNEWILFLLILSGLTALWSMRVVCNVAPLWDLLMFVCNLISDQFLWLCHGLLKKRCVPYDQSEKLYIYL